MTRLVIPDSDDSDSDTSEEHLVVDDDNEDNPRDLVLKILDDIVSRVISNNDTDPRVIESETHVSEVRVGHGIFTGFIASFMVFQYVVTRKRNFMMTTVRKMKLGVCRKILKNHLLMKLQLKNLKLWTILIGQLTILVLRRR